MSQCVVLVTNRKYLRRCLLTVWQLRFFGKYRGDVVVIVGSDLVRHIPVLEKLFLRISPVYFPEFDLSSVHSRLHGAQGLGGTEFTKTFQYHKFHVFDEYFTRWKRVLYLDSGMTVLRPIKNLWSVHSAGALVAHSDAFPSFVWKLRGQFNWVDFPDLEPDMEHLLDLDTDYFQTTMMLFDTSIISPATVQELVDLTHRFPNSRTNDQGIVNLWALPKGLWKSLPTSRIDGSFLYDFAERDGLSEKDYVLLKYPRKRKLAGHGPSTWMFRWYWRWVMWKMNQNSEKSEKTH